MRCRTVLWYLIFTGSTLNMIVMSNMNIALVAMVRKVAVNTVVGGNITSSAATRLCYNMTVPNVTISESEIFAMPKNLHQSMFDWNGHEQSMVLGAIYWLSWTTNIPGGILANKYGPKVVFGVANFVAAIINFVIPMATYFDIYVLIVVRAIQGLIVGFTFPCLHTITARWIPVTERGTFITSYLGGTVAIAVGYPIFGWLMTVRRWDDIFYVSGIFGVIWAGFWYFLMFDTPSQHPRITREEREFIEKSLETGTKLKSQTPWKRLILSVQVWLNVLANFSFMWIFFLAQVYFPMYFRMIHHLQFSSTALISGLPHVIRLITSLLTSSLSDWLLRTKRIQRTNLRKMSTVICTFIPGVLLLGLARADCDTGLAVAVVFVLIACTGLPSSGFYAAIVDISPNFCSIIYGMALTAGTLSGILLTSYVGWITQNDGYQAIEKWNEIFTFVGCMGILTGTLYAVLAKANVQRWNNPDGDTCDCAAELKAINNNSPPQLQEEEEQQQQPLKSFSGN